MKKIIITLFILLGIAGSTLQANWRANLKHIGCELVNTSKTALQAAVRPVMRKINPEFARRVTNQYFWNRSDTGRLIKDICATIQNPTRTGPLKKMITKDTLKPTTRTMLTAAAGTTAVGVTWSAIKATPSNPYQMVRAALKAKADTAIETTKKYLTASAVLGVGYKALPYMVRLARR